MRSQVSAPGETRQSHAQKKPNSLITSILSYIVCERVEIFFREGNGTHLVQQFLDLL